MPLLPPVVACAVAVASTLALRRGLKRRDDASLGADGEEPSTTSGSTGFHESPRAPGILPEYPVGTFCTATQRSAALSAASNGAMPDGARLRRLQRLQAATVLQATKYVQLISCFLVVASLLGVAFHNDLQFSLLSVAALLVLIIVVLEVAVRRPAAATSAEPPPEPEASTAESEPPPAGQLLRAVMPHVHMLPYSAQDISGLWIKDRQRSDSMSAACDLMQMNGIVRKAIVLVKGIQLWLTDTRFTVSVVSIIPILKISEWYNVNGQMAQFKRRDLRRGKHFGRIEVTSAGIVLIVRWDEPLAGYGSEVFRLVSKDELHVESQMRVGRHEVKYTVIYNKKR